MTTIACNREGMASDTYINDGSRAAKIVRGSNVLIGEAGDFWYSRILSTWLLEGRRGPVPEPGLDTDKATEEGDLLILRKDGIYVMNARGIEIIIHDEFFAVGSGSNYAMGAMAAGATPQEAVEIACRYDESTKGPVVWEPLKRNRKEK